MRTETPTGGWRRRLRRVSDLTHLLWVGALFLFRDRASRQSWETSRRQRGRGLP